MRRSVPWSLGGKDYDFGQCQIGEVRGGPSAPDVFSLSLGLDSPRGAVLFTYPSRSGLNVGGYRVAEAGSPDCELQALAVLGSADQPEGVFRGTAGTLTITSVSDVEITGLFSVNADGFLAVAPDRENRPGSVPARSSLGGAIEGFR